MWDKQLSKKKVAVKRELRRRLNTSDGEVRLIVVEVDNELKKATVIFEIDLDVFCSKS